MAVPTSPNWAAAETITESKLDSISTVLDFLLARPRCYAYKTADGALAHATWDAINFGSEAYDSHTAHDNSTNNTRLTAPETGMYRIVGHAVFDTNATGIRGLDIRKNSAASHAGGTDLCEVIGAGNGTTQARIIATVDAQLVAGDYVELFCYQGSGSSLNVLGGQANTFLHFAWSDKTV